MEFKYYGHSCFGIKIGEKNLLFDPFISGNPLVKDIVDTKNIKADYILVSHGHGDHMGDLISLAKQNNSTIISIFEITEWCQKQGIQNVHPLNFGGQLKLDFCEIKFVQAVHSSVLPDGVYAGNPGGFVVKSNEGNFYYSGDTALTYDMKLIPLYSKLDFAILPIGDNFTMGYEDVAHASDFIECNTIIGVHYDTFDLIKINKEEVIKYFNSKNKKLFLPTINENISF